MNVSDVVVQFLADHGIGDVFMVSGGGIMYLTDALGRAGTPRYWVNYHEQASAIAAEGYARITGRPGVCLVTTGPGSTNALSGLAGAWVDSIPVIAISGQVRRDLIADYSRWRQLGPQEVDIVSMAKPVTKLALEVESPDDVPRGLQEAWRAATSGRPGPVWLSIPLDVQGSNSVPVVRRDAAPPSPDQGATVPGPTPAVLNDVVERLRQAARPLILCGNGIHLARAEAQFREFVGRLGIPVVTTIGAMDLLGEESPYFVGRFGPTGQRRANFAVQNADVLLCLATGMSVAAIGFDSAGFAPRAAKIMVNVDAEEMARPHLRLDLAIAMDVRDFMRDLLEALPPAERFEVQAWTSACRSWKQRYPLVTGEYVEDHDHVNSYYLAHSLSKVLTADDVVLTGNSLDAHSVFHSFAVTLGQRVVTNVNYGAMGWDLPALVGVCAARGAERVVLVTGDGSIQFNSQELLTIGSRRLNAVIFVLNNEGYQSIRSTQQRFFEGRLVGSDGPSGLANPLFELLARAYGLKYHRLATNSDVDAELEELVNAGGPTLCEVNVGYAQERIPRVVSRRLADGTLSSGALHDQYPHLPDVELQDVMSVSAGTEEPRDAADRPNGSPTFTQEGS
jgi:acetolactate synthase-1/2/3 large subunit